MILNILINLGHLLWQCLGGVGRGGRQEGEGDGGGDSGDGAGDRGIEEGGRDRREGRDVKKRLAAFLCFPFIGSNLLTWFMYIFIYLQFFFYLYFLLCILWYCVLLLVLCMCVLRWRVGNKGE